MTNNTPWEEDSIQVNDADGNLAFEVIDLVKPDKLVPTFVKGAESVSYTHLTLPTKA